VIAQEVVLPTSDGRRRFTIDDDFCASSGVSAANRETVKVFICSWLALLSDSPLDPENGPKPKKLFKKFLEDIRTGGFKATVLRYSDLAHRMASQAYLYGTSSFNDEFIDDFKDTPVFMEYHRYFRSEDPSLFRYLYTFLTFGKKLPYEDPEFEKTAFRGWLDLENELSTWSYDEGDLVVLKSIMNVLLPRLTLDGFYPKFGPKAVSERSVHTRIDKVEAFKYDAVINRHIFGGLLGHYGSGEDHGLTPARAIPNCPAWGKREVTSSRTARLRFVPKDLKTARSICMEPSVLMFFQQGIWDRIENTLTETPYRWWIRFRDQSYNTALATFGSYTGEIDTIDLSSASDSVTLALVKGIFPSTWQIAMRATRSANCFLPNGKKHKLTKFAPMGSALCFPTQSLIFATVCIYAALVYQHQVTGVALNDRIDSASIMKAANSFKRDLEGRGQFEPLGVYGDDICVDRRLTEIVINILLRLGFRVNHTKSFRGSQAFRESCGAYVLNGHRVDPMYYRVKYRGTHDASSIASMVALSNRCFDMKYANLRRFLIKHLLHNKIKGIRLTARNPILFVLPSDDTFGIKSEYPYNALRRRDNKGYQREEWKSIGISYDWKVKDTKHVTDSYDYMRWMASRRRASSVPVEGTHGVHTGGARVIWRWTPVTE
jgi:hypothetical protein